MNIITQLWLRREISRELLRDEEATNIMLVVPHQADRIYYAEETARILEWHGYKIDKVNTWKVEAGCCIRVFLVTPAHAEAGKGLSLSLILTPDPEHCEGPLLKKVRAILDFNVWRKSETRFATYR